MWYEPINDPVLFNQDEFLKSLESGEPAVIIFKDTIQNANQYLIEEFDAGGPVKELLYKRAWFIDQLLIHAWQQNVDSGHFALVAVGGYGRRELHPGSDIDIMILTAPHLKLTMKRQLESFLAFLWDIGLEIGHSARTVKECTREAKADITIVTNLMEARLLTGEQQLFEAMLNLTGPKKIWPARKFFEAKLQEQIARHNKFDGTEYKLEPNIKEGPGGLRDIQVVDWVAKRQYGANRLRELVDYGFLTRNEYESLAKGREFLWRVRFALHILTSRREDRLLFDHQRSVARIFGHHSNDNSAVEQFMKGYYKTVRELNRLNEMLLQHFQEAIIYARRKEKIKPLNKRFQIRNDFIEVRDKNVFKRAPFALLELFLLIQQTRSIKGVRASTIRLIRESTGLIDDDFRNDLRNKSLFLEIIKQPRRVGHELRRMHRYGVLCAYLPEFARIEGLMQFDLFHIYTVDEHILFVVRNMRQFALEEHKNRFPHCREVLQSIPKQELLYLAGMFHDIAKGFDGGNHSDNGADAALAFCRRHLLPEFDSKLVVWLVQNHLLMSKTAQRKDINDPDVINQFAKKAGDVMHLDYLYLLTVADIYGTNPKMWNSWKDSLIAELYQRTLRALRRGLENPIDKTERIQEVKQAAMALMAKPGTDIRKIETLWGSLGEDYFIKYSPEEIAWQTRLITRVSGDNLPLVSVLMKSNRGGSEIFIYMPDRDYIFSRITTALDILGLNIVDARIITSTNGYTLDTFIVLEESGEIIKGRERIREIKEIIKKELMSLDKPAKKISRIKSTKLRNFPIPTQVNFTQDKNNSRTVMEVIATDRAGLLSRVGLAMEFCSASLQSAKIATYGERVEDIFFITGRDDKMLTDEIKLECLRNTIIDSLDNN
ncbi:MAG: [protein-PII] uridylyltransferase [Gammaproteobacteria bacterium]